MPAKISDVLKGSIAEDLGLGKNDEIISIDDYPLQDMIDYNFYIKNEVITILVKRQNGELEEIEIEKDFDDDLGIIFESAVFDGVKPCLNNCLFCFVSQQPDGLRNSLYVKDDDYRLSFLQGTYITTTNWKEEDKKRISQLHLGPLYISVHTTNPELRVKMLKNPNAAKIMDNLKWLKSEEIPFHVQIVLCPGYNDSDELRRTLKDLESLGEALLSVAIVPVGVTKFRKDKLKQVDKKVAEETIKISEPYKKVCCSDEFFLLAEKPIPKSDYYGNFSQLDDGVGALRLFTDNFDKIKLPKSVNSKLSVLFACSSAAKSVFEYICEKMQNIKNLEVGYKEVVSSYWGENITVAGLITSKDLIKAIKDTAADVIFVPGIMLKPYTDLFLDGESLSNVSKNTGKNFVVIKDNYSIKEAIEYIKQYSSK